MDIHDTLAEAIALVEHGKQRAFGAGVVVDQDRMLHLLSHARSALPEEILAAASILAQRAQIVATGQDDADQMRTAAGLEVEQIRSAALVEAEAMRSSAAVEASQIRDRAQEERRQLLDEHEVLREAVARGDEALARAHHQAQAMRAEVDAYVDAKLAAIAATLSRALDTIESGRRKARAHEHSVLDESVGAH